MQQSGNYTGFYQPPQEYVIGEQVPVQGFQTQQQHTPQQQQTPQVKPQVQHQAQQQVQPQVATAQVFKVQPQVQPQPVPQQAVQKQEPVGSIGEDSKKARVDIVTLTPEQVSQFVEQLKPATMSNPVRITQSGYVLTDEQMLYLLSLAQGQPISNLLGEETPKNRNIVDTLCNATLGTAGRLGHTLTGFVDGIIDILTLGYSSK